jgi:hypothetical protein
VVLPVVLHIVLPARPVTGVTGLIPVTAVTGRTVPH